MATAYPVSIEVPSGLSYVVSITPSAAIFTTAALGTPATFPQTITTATTWFANAPGGYTVSCQWNSVELIGTVQQIGALAGIALAPVPTLTQVASSSVPVSLTSVNGTTAGGASTPQNVYTTVLTTPSLATGTWLVSVDSQTTTGGTLTAVANLKLANGGGTGTLAGGLLPGSNVLDQKQFDSTGYANLYGTVLLTVTVAGTFVVQLNPGAVGAGGSSTNAGYTAVKIA